MDSVLVVFLFHDIVQLAQHGCRSSRGPYQHNRSKIEIKIRLQSVNKTKKYSAVQA